MSWGLTLAIGMAALLALVNVMRLCLSRLTLLEKRIGEGRGLSPSLLLAVTPDAAGLS